MTQTSAPVTTLTPSRLRALSDWRIRAQLYRDNARPAALRYAPDSALDHYANECRNQEQLLEPFRRGLVNAPDPQLAIAAKRFDTATHQYLEACRANQAVALHQADGAMKVAAAEVNLRYDRLVGKDPAGTDAQPIL
jgi:hypothetical protein